MDIVEKSNRTLLRIEDNDPKLTSLSIVDRGHTAHNPEECFWMHDGADLSRLGSAIANNIHLETISFFKSSEWTLDTGSLLEGLQRNTTIKKLWLHGGIGIGVLNEFVANNSNLTRISILDCDLRDGIVESIVPALKLCPNLSHIMFLHSKIDDASLKAFALGIRGLSSLRRLDLIHTNGDHTDSIHGIKGAEAIATLLQDPSCNITQLDLACFGFSSDSIQIIINGLIGNTKLVKLDLYGNKIERSGCESIINLLQTSSCNLTRLNLGRCNLNNEAVTTIVRSLAGNTKLEHLGLSKSHIKSSGCELIITLLQDPSCNINSLDLGRCGLKNDLTTKIVSSLIGNTKMAKLDLSSNGIGRSGCESIATLLQDPNSNVENVSLLWNNLGTRLPSDDNVINDDCARILAQALVGNNKLTCLDLRRSSITKPGWNAFSNILSNCSNHTLSSFGPDYGTPFVPDNLSTLLELNRAVDMEPLFELDTEGDERKPKALPYVIDWFDRHVRESTKDEEVVKGSIEARKLSAIFQFARAMPLKFVPSPTKSGAKESDISSGLSKSVGLLTKKRKHGV